MKIAFPKNSSFRSSRRSRALTILEMLVSTAMLAFIVLGLTAMFVETQKAFKLGIKQSDVTDGGRSIMAMISSDLQQMSDAHLTNIQNFYFQSVPSVDLIQENNAVFRTNELDDVFTLVHTNATWLGIGYCVSNWLTVAGAQVPGVGTLYRYVAQTNGPLDNYNTLLSDFNKSIGVSSLIQPSATNFHRIADGVVHLKIYAYDADGNEDRYQSSGSSFAFVYPYRALNANGSYFTDVNGQWATNFLPRSLDIELGILEPETFEHVRALFQAGSLAAAGQLLTNSMGKVEIFRQHIIIPAASATPPN